MHYQFARLFFAIILSTFLYTETAPIVYAVNFGSDSVSVIDTATNSVIQTVAVGTQPRVAAVTPNNQYLYVVNSGSDRISVIEIASNTVISTIVSTGGTQPGDIIFSPDGAYGYIANEGQDTVSVLDTSTNQIIKMISLPGSGVTCCSVTPDSGTLYAFGFSNNVAYVIETANNTVTSTFSLGADTGAFDSVITPDGRYIYVSGTNSNVLRVVDTTDNSVTTPIDLTGSSFAGLTITPDGSRLYLIDSDPTIVYVVRTSDNSIIQSISLPSAGAPQFITLTPDAEYAYVTNFNTDNVSVIETAGNTVVDTISVGDRPIGIASTLLAPAVLFLGKQFINNFGVANEVFNKLTWQASSSGISGYRIARNGVTIATLNSSARSYEDHNRSPHTIDVYTLTAFHNSGSNSFSVTISVGG